MKFEDLQLLTDIAGIGSILILLLTPLLALLAFFMIWRVWRTTAASTREIVRLNQRFDQVIATLESREAVALPAEEANPEPSITSAPAELLPPTKEEPAPSVAEEEEASAPPAVEEEEPPAPPAEEEEDLTQSFAAEEKELFGGADILERTEENALPSFDADEPEGDEEAPPAEAFAEERDRDVFSFSPDPEWATPSERLGDDPFSPQEPPLSAEPEIFPAAAAEEEFPSIAPWEPEPQIPVEEAIIPSLSEAPVQAADREEKPALIRLEDDPARPGVSLIRCCACSHKLAYKKALVGKRVKCPSCKTSFVLP